MYQTKRHPLLWLMVVILFCISPLAVMAQDTKNLTIVAGAGPGCAPDYEGSDSYELVPIVFARADWSSGRYIHFQDLTLSANAIASKTWEIGPVVRYRPKRDDVHNSKVDDLDEVDAAVEIGGFVGFNIKEWRFSLEAVQDVADGHDGALVAFSIDYVLDFSEKIDIFVSAFTTYADDDYMQSYFEVDRRDAARSGLDEYNADADLKDVGASWMVRYDISDKWDFTGTLKYTRLFNDAKSTPIVDDEGDPNQYSGGIAVVYSF